MKLNAPIITGLSVPIMIGWGSFCRWLAEYLGTPTGYNGWELGLLFLVFLSPAWIGLIIYGIVNNDQ